MKTTLLAMGMALGVLGVSQTAAARVVVFTGAPSPTCGSRCSTLDSSHWLAAQFKVSANDILEMVSGYIGARKGKTFTLALLSDIAGEPGVTLYTAQAKYNTHVGWQGLNTLYWPAPKGTYWIAFEVTPSDNLSGYMPAPAPQPLKTSDLGLGGLWSPDNQLDFGVRIYHQVDGTKAALLTPSDAGGVSPGAVPEPASWATLLLGVGAVGGALRGRRRSARVCG